MSRKTKTVSVSKNTSFYVENLPSGWARTGYTFLGWDLNSNANSATYPEGSLVENGFDSDKRLFAIW